MSVFGTTGAALIILCLKFMRAARCATGVRSFFSPLPLPRFCSASVGSASAGGRRLLACRQGLPERGGHAMTSRA